MKDGPNKRPDPTGKPVLDLLNGHETEKPPIWLMRQAGRYLPEYRDVRAKAGHFLELCYRPELAVEVTLQPIRRFGFDAAILFADILLIAQSLGQDLDFREGEGPVLTPIGEAADLRRLSLARSAEILAPIAETVRRLRSKLPRETTLIGFAGAPWTVASYMIAGRGTTDQAPARLMAYRAPDLFQALMDLLVPATADYLLAQIAAGADVVQIFDSWAGSLPEDEFSRWVIAPSRQIVERIRKTAPDIPIIGFARGAGMRHAAYAKALGIAAVSVETQLASASMVGLADLGLAVQGNLDPLLLVAGGSALDHAADELKRVMKGRRHIFNLGHGILPETPIAHVERLIEKVRQA